MVSFLPHLTMNPIQPNEPQKCLNWLRLPARLHATEAAVLLGFQAHDIPLIIKAGLLKPLGGGPRNTVKYFAAVDLQEKATDVKWLDKATRAISRRAQNKEHPAQPN